MEEDLVLDYLIQEFQFDDSSTGFILFQLNFPEESSSSPMNDGTGNGSGIYRFSLPIPSYSGVLSLITDSHLLSTLEDPTRLLPLQLSIFILGPTMTILGRAILHFDEELFLLNNQDTDGSSISQPQSLIWTYEYDSMINHAIGVGTMNGSIRGTIHLHKLPRFKDQMIPQPKDEFIETGEGSLDVTEFLPTEDTSDSSSFEEPLFKLTLPRSTAEPLDRRQKPLRYFMSVGDQREIQTEYRPGYRRLLAQQSTSPPRLSTNRSRWSLSQSVRSLNPPPPRDHLLRCVACWLKSTQCQNCVDGQLSIDAPSAPVAAAAAPPPQQRHHPPLPTRSQSQSQRPPAKKVSSSSLSKPPTEMPRQQKPRSKSQPRSRPTPTAITRTPTSGSSSRRIRQHTFSSAVAAKPSSTNSRKTSRGFHFVNPQPSDLPSSQGRGPQRTSSAQRPREGKPRSSNSPRQSRTTSLHRNQPEDLPQQLGDECDPLADCGYYPKISSPVETSEDRQDEREGVVLHITSNTRIPPSGRSGDDSAIFTCWEMEDQILYIDGS
jgi:hypothetical protein